MVFWPWASWSRQPHGCYIFLFEKSTATLAVLILFATFTGISQGCFRITNNRPELKTIACDIFRTIFEMVGHCWYWCGTYPAGTLSATGPQNTMIVYYIGLFRFRRKLSRASKVDEQLTCHTTASHSSKIGLFISNRLDPEIILSPILKIKWPHRIRYFWETCGI